MADPIEFYVEDIDNLGCKDIDLLYSLLEFKFKASDLLFDVVCSGLRKAYAFFYYENGKRVSRRKLHIPSFKPCYPNDFDGCIKWIDNIAYRYRNGKFRKTKYVLPPNVEVRLREITIRDLRGKPFCYAMIKENNKTVREKIGKFFSDTYFSVEYTKKKEQKGKHDLYIECHHIGRYDIDKYNTGLDLLKDVVNEISKGNTCIYKFLVDNGFFYGIEQTGYACGTNFDLNKPAFKSMCMWGHYKGMLSGRVRC